MKQKHFLALLLVLYGFHLILKFSHIPVPTFVSSYLADLLCTPILLSIASIILAKTKQNPHFQLSTAMIIFLIVYVSIVFEFILPYYFPKRFTSDYYDIVAYGIGAFLFVLKSTHIRSNH